MIVPAKASASPSVCVVTSELIGWGETTEIGAAMTAVAQNLARAGEAVILAWVPDGRIPPEKAEELKKYYQRQSITLELLWRSDQLLYPLYSVETRSMGVYHYLKENSFSTVYIGLEKGLAYYSLLAKATDLFSPRPQFTVIAHAPIAWQSETDRFFLENVDQVAIAETEKYCVRSADRLICVSSNLLSWFKAKNWQLPEKFDVMPALTPREWEVAADSLPRRLHAGIKEIVLLAGTGFREGITLFCDALDELARLERSDITVTAFGPFGQILGEHTGGMIVRRARRWPFEVRLFPTATFYSAIQYTAEHGALAVIPNYDAATGLGVSACLRVGIPFIATNVGANADSIPPAFHKHCLANPKAKDLAAAIDRQIGKPVVATPLLTEEEKGAAWLKAHRSKMASAARPARLGEPPFVSVVLVHHDRPQTLLQAVKSLEDQDYRNFEVVLVDDGSKLPESREVLDRLESGFAARGWRIIRAENKYVGAARNTGVKASRGEMIVLMDDDNALFRGALSKFVHAIEASGADICTSCQKIFYDSHVPGSEGSGFIQYHFIGTSLDLGLIFDTFGDTNAIYRRSVFDKIGYQLEKHGYMTEDWEFFARAALADLKLIMIPDPLYWYRSNTQGRYRTSHWYDNRQPILAAYKKHEFKGLEYAYHLIMAQNVTQWEKQGYRTNLRFSPSDTKYLELCEAEPNSEKALSLLARIATSEGRPETGMTLLTGLPHLEFNNQSRRLLDAESSRENVLKVTGTAFAAGHTLTHQELLSLESSTTGPVRDPASLFYVESPDRFFLQAEDSSISLAVLPAGCPAGTVAVSAQISLDQALSEKAEFMIMVCAMHEDPVLAVQTGSAKPSEGYSGWIEVTEPLRPTTIEARLSTPSATPSNLIFAVRNAKGGTKSVLGCFAGIKILNSAADAVKRRPRIGAPAHKLRAREWTDKERKSAHLITKYRSDLPLMLLPPEGQGIFLRPSLSGPVVAVIDEGFPAFARRLLAKVEIAHEEASPFEFAVALNLLSKPTQWKPAGPVNAIAFSGWIRVNERFKLHDIKLGLRELISSPLSINLAVRVPKGSAPSPSNAFWRNLIFMWDE